MRKMDYTIKKLTDCRWLNLYDVDYNHNGRSGQWTMCSRKENPIAEANRLDAVVIIPILETPEGKRLVVTKEYRVPIGGYEYGFPAGLIDAGESVETTVKRELKEETGLDLKRIRHISMPVFSSAGMTDESCVMVIVEAQGEVSNQYLEDNEDIEALPMQPKDITELLNSDNFIAAKAWGILYHYHLTGVID